MRNRWVVQAGTVAILFCSIFVLAGCVILVSSVVGGADERGSSDLVPGAIFLTIAWSGVRVGLGLRRAVIDVSDAGLHVRNIFGEETIPWERVTGFARVPQRRRSVSGYWVVRDDERVIPLDALGRGAECTRLLQELSEELRRRRGDGTSGAMP